MYRDTLMAAQTPTVPNRCPTCTVPASPGKIPGIARQNPGIYPLVAQKQAFLGRFPAGLNVKTIAFRSVKTPNLFPG